jgi:glycosyltransferase involved in cell wall biosynthesis
MSDGAEAKSSAQRVLAPTLDQDRIADVYRAANVVLVPSLADNFPNVVLEAMACGVPCVAFDTGGIKEAVRHLKTGLLAPQGDVEKLASELERLLQDKELRQRLGHEARQTATAEYGLKLQSQRYLQLYEELAS